MNSETNLIQIEQTSLLVAPEGGMFVVKEESTAIFGIGIQGADGASVNSFLHTQSSASSIWTINHNLGYFPIIEVRSVGGVVVDADVQHTSTNQSIIYFSSAQAGQARCV